MSEEQPQPVRARGLLIGLGLAMVVLSGVFGWRTLQQRQQYRDYKDATVDPADLPWSEGNTDVQTCVSWTVEWGMACTGLESWCLNEAPRLTLECLSSSDRTAYCEEVGDAVSSTRFGYAQCEAMREQVEGRYLKRAHKKYCASVYRAVAEHCRQP